MLELTVWMALLTGFYLAPVAHWWVRRTKCWCVRAIIPGLVFAPGLCATALGVWFVNTTYFPVTRWSLVYFLQGAGALRCLVAISGITAVYLGGCLLLERFPSREDRDGGGGAVRLVGVWPSLVAIQLALTAAAVYLYTYDTLGDAVSSDNLALAERRLSWNLEGLGPNNGLMVRASYYELVLHPLLPEAVRNGNQDMVKLLVKRGAESYAKDRDAGGSGPSPETSLGDTLYFAVRNHDIEMINLLINLGVNPEQGILPALLEQDRDLLDLLMKKGVSVEFALDTAKQNHISQQKIDELFADYIPKTEVEAGQ